MESRHRLLERQVRRYLGDQPLPEGIQMFLDAVNAAYDAFEKDQALLERSLDLSSKNCCRPIPNRRK